MHLIDLYLEELSKVRNPNTIEKKKYLLYHLEDVRDFSKRGCSKNPSSGPSPQPLRELTR
jgi:hypothetical protein